MKRFVPLVLPVLLVGMQLYWAGSGESATETAVVTRPGAGQLLVADLEKMPVRLLTDAGEQKSYVKRGKVFLRRLADGKSPPQIQVEALNLIVAATQTKMGKGSTGQISLSTPGGLRPAVARKGEAEDLRAELRFNVHYPLITQLKGYGELADRKDPDDFPALTEELIGTFKAQLIARDSKDLKQRKDVGSLILKTEVALGNKVAVGAIRRLYLDGILRVFELPFRFCNDGQISGTRTVRVRPIYVRANAADSTADQETYFATEIANANTLWERCCVRFEVADAMFVNRESLQTVNGSDTEITAEESDLLDEVDDEDAIEIYVIERWNPEYFDGGGVTFSGGTAESKIITAEHDQLPTNQRHFAHELGHVLTLCHPTGGTCNAPRVRGSTDSVMEPSGYFADNPDVQTQANCENITNPLVESSLSRCCWNPDS